MLHEERGLCVSQRAVILKCVKSLLANWQLDFVVAQELQLFANMVGLLFLQYKLILIEISQCIKETIKPFYCILWESFCCVLWIGCKIALNCCSLWLDIHLLLFNKWCFCLMKILARQIWYYTNILVKARIKYMTFALISVWARYFSPKVRDSLQILASQNWQI